MDIASAAAAAAAPRHCISSRGRSNKVAGALTWNDSAMSVPISRSVHEMMVSSAGNRCTMIGGYQLLCKATNNVGGEQQIYCIAASCIQLSSSISRGGGGATQTKARQQRAQSHGNSMSETEQAYNRQASRRAPPWRWYALSLDIRWISSGRERSPSPITTSPTPPLCSRMGAAAVWHSARQTLAGHTHMPYVHQWRHASLQCPGNKHPSPGDAGHRGAQKKRTAHSSPHLHQLHADMAGALVIPQTLLVQPVHLDPLQRGVPHGCPRWQAQAGCAPAVAAAQAPASQAATPSAAWLAAAC